MHQSVLILTTSVAQAPERTLETGFDWMSLAVPYWRLREAGVEIGFASVRGGKPPGDPTTATLGETDADARAGAVDMFLGDERAVMSLAQSQAIADVDPEAWQALLVVDGTGALWDLKQTAEVARLVSALWAAEAVVATIGAGAAALVDASTDDGRPLVAGLRMTCLPARSSAPAEPPYDLEQALRDKGARLYTGEIGADPVVLEEGRLITAQDARAAAEVALQLLDAIEVYAPSATAAAARAPD